MSLAVDNIVCNWVDLKHAFHQGKSALYVILLTRSSNFKADHKIDSNDTDSNVHFEQVRITLSSTTCKYIYTTFNQLCLITSNRIQSSEQAIVLWYKVGKAYLAF